MMVVMFYILVAVLLPGRMSAISSPTLVGQIKETIVKVRTGETYAMARTYGAEHLADLTAKVNPSEIDDETFGNIVSLLDTPNDSVRAWVAASLGNLGTRAKPAIPALLKVLAEVDCLRVDASSAGFIRTAIKKMGVKPPPPPQCNY